MAQIDLVYEFLKNNFKENEPIFLSELRIPGVKEVSLRPQLKKLVEQGKIKRFDNGIYYRSKKSMFRSGSVVSIEDVIRKKYLIDDNGKCGYYSGMLFANQLGITTQVPMIYEVCTNRATTDYREVQLSGIRVIIRKPYVEVNEKNADELQFLDLLKDVQSIAELDTSQLKIRLVQYMRDKRIGFEALKPLLKYYPEKIYKNMFEVGLLNGILA